MPLTADGRYDPNAPGTPPPAYESAESADDYLSSLAIWMTWGAPSDMLRNAATRPPRFGQVVTQPTIYDVLSSTSRLPQERALDFSGGPAGYAGGTSTPSLGSNW